MQFLYELLNFFRQEIEFVGHPEILLLGLPVRQTIYAALRREGWRWPERRAARVFHAKARSAKLALPRIKGKGARARREADGSARIGRASIKLVEGVSSESPRLDCRLSRDRFIAHATVKS
jgi:hypothetical protein